MINYHEAKSELKKIIDECVESSEPSDSMLGDYDIVYKGYVFRYTINKKIQHPKSEHITSIRRVR